MVIPTHYTQGSSILSFWGNATLLSTAAAQKPSHKRWDTSPRGQGGPAPDTPGQPTAAAVSAKALRPTRRILNNDRLALMFVCLFVFQIKQNNEQPAPTTQLKK